MKTRQLVPAYIFKSATLAWCCDRCHKTFLVCLEELQAQGIPSHILSEFRVHLCVPPQRTGFEDTQPAEHDWKDFLRTVRPDWGESEEQGRE